MGQTCCLFQDKAVCKIVPVILSVSNCILYSGEAEYDIDIWFQVGISVGGRDDVQLLFVSVQGEGECCAMTMDTDASMDGV